MSITGDTVPSTIGLAPGEKRPESVSDIGKQFTHNFAKNFSPIQFYKYLNNETQAQRFFEIGKQFEPDATFNSAKGLLENGVNPAWHESLLATNSQQEYNFISDLLRKEQEKNALLNTSGFGKFAGGTSGFLLDPAEWALYVARGPKALAFATTVVGAKETFLADVDPDRTMRDAAINTLAAGGLTATAIKLQKLLHNSNIELRESIRAARHFDNVKDEAAETVAKSVRVENKEQLINYIRQKEIAGAFPEANVADEMITFINILPEAFISGAAFKFRSYSLTPSEMAARYANYPPGLAADQVPPRGIYNEIYDLITVLTNKEIAPNVLRHEVGHRVMTNFLNAKELEHAAKIYGDIPLGQEISNAFLQRYPINEQFKEWFAESFNLYWNRVLSGEIPRAKTGIEGIFESVASRIRLMTEKYKGTLSEQKLMDNFFSSITRRGDKIDINKYLATVTSERQATQQHFAKDWDAETDWTNGSASLEMSQSSKRIKESINNPTASDFELAPAAGLEKLLDSPLKRLAHAAASPVAKRLLPVLAELPVYLKGNFAGQALGRGVDAMMRVRWIGPMSQAMKSTEEFYKQYRIRLAAPSAKADSAGEAITGTSWFDATDALSKVEFLKLVGTAKKALDDPGRLAAFPQEAIAAARVWHSKIYQPLGEMAKKYKMFSIAQVRELNVLKKEIGKKKATPAQKDKIKELEAEIKQLDNIEIRPSFLNRIYDINKVNANKKQLMQVLIRHGRTTEEAENSIKGILGQKPLSPEEEILGHGKEAVGRARSLKTRTLDDIPDIDLDFVLESNIFSIGDYYTRRMGADVELTRAFGSIDLYDELKAITAHWDNKIDISVKAGKDITKLQKRQLQELDDVRAVRDRIRGTYGLPDDPNSWTPRTIRAAKMMNAMSLLTGALAQVPDIAMLILTNNISRTFGTTFETLIKGTDGLKLALKDAQLAGEALDMYLSTRAAIYADLGEVMGTTSTFERAASKSTQLFFTASGMNPWNVGVKTLASLMAGSRIYDEALHLVNGTADAGMIRRLARANITKKDAKIIVEQFDKHGLQGNHVKVAKADDWDDVALSAKETYLAALSKEINLTIVTPGKAEIPNILSGGLEKLNVAKTRKASRSQKKADNVPLTYVEEVEDMFMGPQMSQLLFQFKTFGAAAAARVITPALQAPDKDVIFGLIYLVGLGAMVDSIRREQLGTSNVSLDQRMWSALERSAVLGNYGEPFNIAKSLIDPRFGLGGTINSLGGPIVQQGTNAVNVLSDVISGNIDQNSIDDGIELLPMSNVFYTNDMMNWLRDSEPQNEMVQ